MYKILLVANIYNTILSVQSTTFNCICVTIPNNNNSRRCIIQWKRVMMFAAKASSAQLMD